jgi:DNA-3-methyladenine glycosylase II
VITERTFAEGLSVLTRRDARLARVVDRYGPPPLWTRPAGFPTLLHIILEQQVSLASARAAFDRLRAAARPLTPRRFLALDDRTLRAIGFSRQKTAYGRHLADAIARGRLDLQALTVMDDAQVREELMKVKGIGRWTADIYLLMALRRPDTWPAGDLALAMATQRLRRLTVRPTPARLAASSDPAVG